MIFFWRKKREARPNFKGPLFSYAAAPMSRQLSLQERPLSPAQKETKKPSNISFKPKSECGPDCLLGGTKTETDVVIIGAGPVGLFAVFELGLLGISCVLIDILEKVGGQCSELYPDKPIYDIPAWPVITGEDLTQRLLEQIAPFKPRYLLHEMATALDKTETGWRIRTDQGSEVIAKAVVIAAGGGAFQAKKPPIAGIEAYENLGEGAGVAYRVRKSDAYREKAVVVSGGGDSALDWAIRLCEVGAYVVLVHRSDTFRAAPHSVEKMRKLVAEQKMDFIQGTVVDLKGEPHKALKGVIIQDGMGVKRLLECEAFLPFFGLTMKLGPVAEFGLNLHENLIPVDTAAFETATPSIFAIGDINTYAGKLKLILSGFHEAALMAQKAFGYVFPDKPLRFQYTTSSSDLQRKLGVKE